jgi:hypothetical protein
MCREARSARGMSRARRTSVTTPEFRQLAILPSRQFVRTCRPWQPPEDGQRRR